MDEVASEEILLESAEQVSSSACSEQFSEPATIPGHPNLRPWRKGQSGNPKGKPPSVDKQLKRLLRHGVDREVAKNAIAIACNLEHPLCMAAIKWIADRVDGPLERSVKHTLNIPSVSFEVHLNAPGQRVLPALPSTTQPAIPEQRVIDVTSEPTAT